MRESVLEEESIIEESANPGDDVTKEFEKPQEIEWRETFKEHWKRSQSNSNKICKEKKKEAVDENKS